MPFFCAARSKFHDRSLNNQTTTVVYTQPPQQLDISERTVPATWLPLPAVDPSESKVLILNAVFPEHNFVALYAIGAYTVDWGDGVVENFATATTAYHQYDYTTIPENTDSGLGYRQVIIQISPQAGQSLTTVRLDQPPVGLGSTLYTSNFTMFAVSAPTLITLAVGDRHPMLEQVDVQRSACTSFLFSGLTKLHTVVNLVSTAATLSMANVFKGCASLVNLPVDWDMTNITTMYGGFENCTSLRGLKSFDAPNVTRIDRLFLACASLTDLPVFNVPKATRMDAMFQSCSSLTTGPIMVGTSLVTSTSDMFKTCEVLCHVHPFDTSAVTTTSGMFIECAALNNLPDFHLPNAVNLSSMFQGCTSLRRAPNLTFGTSNVNLGSLFSGCAALEQVPSYNTAGVTSFTSMFSSCRVLRSVGVYDFSSATTVSGMFQACSQLENVQPVFDMPLVTSIGYMFNGCTKLKTAITMDIPSCTAVVAVASGTYNLTELNLTSCQSVLSTSDSTLNPTNKTAFGLQRFTMSGYRGGQSGGKIYLEGMKLGRTALQALVDSFDYPGPYLSTTNSLFNTVVGNTSTTRTISGAENSPTATTTLTTGLVVGMYGIQQKNTIAATGNTFTWTGHTMQVGDLIAVRTVTTITGFTRGLYYVVNVSGNTFQLSLTEGGPAATFSGTGSINIQYLVQVVSFVPNTSITLSRGLAATVTNASQVFNSSQIMARALLSGTTIGA